MNAQIIPGLGHQADHNERMLLDIADTLDKALSDAMSLERRSTELERLIRLAHKEALWNASDEDEYLMTFI